MEGTRVDPTAAKTIALYFIDSKGWKPTSPVIAKTIKQAKNLLEYGFTQEEICAGIDFAKSDMQIDVYSLGFFSCALNDILDKIKAKQFKQELKQTTPALPAAVSEGGNDGTTSRNIAKVNRNSQSYLGEKYNFDCLQEQ